MDTARLNSLPPAAKLNAGKQMICHIFRNSLFLTATKLLGYKDVNWRTHGEMIHALEAHTKRKLLVMPRGTFKSSLGSVAYPIWCLLRDPNERILIDSEVYTNGKNFLREISSHLLSERMTDLFGSFRGPVWNEGEIIIAQRNRVSKEASITASGIGAEKTGQHYDRIVMDDLNSPSNSATPEGRNKVINHYRYNMAILEPHGTAAIIGTRYAANDAIGFVLQNEMGISR